METATAAPSVAEQTAPAAVEPLADARSLTALEFPQILALLARETTTERGHAQALALVPARGLAGAREEQAATSEMRALARGGGLGFPTVADLSGPVERAGRGGTLAGEELRALGIALSSLDAAVRRIRGSGAPVLRARCARAVTLLEILAAIERAIGERGELLDRASPMLGRLRRSVATAHEEARERCAAIVRSPRYARAIGEPIVTLRDGRFVVPVKAEFSGMLPGVVHDTSASGHTLFVEPLDALEANNRLRTLRIDEAREAERRLAELSAQVGARAAGVRENLALLAELDLVLARARLAEKMAAVSPRLVDDARLEVRSGRHPLLAGAAVAQTLTLDETNRVLVVSGPNRGGKTVTLKMAGLFVAMAACGLALPAEEGTAIGAFERLACDLGDEQSIAESSSTFSAHLVRLREILAGAGGRSFVLIDEIARGTEAGAGTALAIAVLEDLVARGARAIVTTHATELKLFAHESAGVRNASVRFDPQTYAPTYEFELGAPGQSLAFALARSLGLDPALVDRAESLQSEAARTYDRAIGELSELRSESAREREQLRAERAALAAREAEARAQGEALARERKRLAGEAETRLSRALREFAQELERRGRTSTRARISAGEASLYERTLAGLRDELGVADAPEAQRERPAQFAVGTRVFVPSLEREGEITDDLGETLQVAIGPMKTVVPKAAVRAAGTRPLPQLAPRAAPAPALAAARDARLELDVRGKRFVEAQPLVERWLEEAALAGLSPLRLIHGKGTGLLGRGLQEFLRTQARVREVRFAPLEQGGSGATLIDLAP
ncbi:MAG: endonuclease MutS2 [Vulcanimicrobiaceae bacterium]